MSINTQFPLAVHALALIALNTDGRQPSTSQLIAKSAGTNPVVVRRILSRLRQAGLVEGGPGKPGNTLKKPAAEISLGDIYRAMREEESLFALHPHPLPQCPVGRHIHRALEQPLFRAQEALEKELDKVSLQQVAGDIAGRAGYPDLGAKPAEENVRREKKEEEEK